jgi:hypothetical protein
MPGGIGVKGFASNHRVSRVMTKSAGKHGNRGAACRVAHGFKSWRIPSSQAWVPFRARAYCLPSAGIVHCCIG